MPRAHVTIIVVFLITTALIILRA